MLKLKHMNVYKALIFILGILFYSAICKAQEEPSDFHISRIQNWVENNAADSACIYFESLSESDIQQLSTNDRGEISYWSGRAYYELRSYEKADHQFEDAIDFALQESDTLICGHAYNFLGKTYKKRSDYSKALQAFNLARDYYYVAGYEKGIAEVRLNVGNVLKNIGRSDLAKKEYLLALEIFQTLNDSNNIAGCYNNLGNIYKNEKNYDSAFLYMYQTLALREQGGATRNKAYIYHNLSNLHLSTKNPDSALYYISKSLELTKQLNSAEDLSNDYNVFGSIYIYLKKWDLAIENLEKAYELVHEDNLSENRLDILRQLGFAYYQKKEFQKSARFFLEFFEKNDSLQILNQGSFIENELLRYEFYSDSIKTKQLQLEQNIQLLKQENTILAGKINFRNFIFLIVILLLTIGLFAILFISAKRRLAQTQRHEAILAVQNQELKRTLISKEEKEILLKEVHHRVKNNLQIINSLIRLQANFMNAKNFKEKLMETENRIRSMALIHEKLYKTGNLASLSVKNYLEELAINILESYENHNVKIKLKFDLEEHEYNIDSLIPLGLIINETLSNSIKHAFYERTEGLIKITMYSNQEHTILEVEDNGIGADLSFDELKEDSLGLELIDSLTEQLDGSFKLETDQGFHYYFTFGLLK